MIVERTKKNSVIVRYRDSDGKRQTTTYSSNPFCYIEASSIGDLSQPFTVLPDKGHMGLFGEPLRRVEFQSTEDLSNAAKKGKDMGGEHCAQQSRVGRKQRKHPDV
mgnify:CR=1 FL=1